MKKILFPTAYSTHSVHYFKYAIELAHKFDAELICMHTFGKVESRNLSKADIVNKSREEMARLKKFAVEHTPQHYNVKLSYHVKQDQPIHAILTAAKEKKADLIVIGMKAKTDHNKAFIGGVAKEVSKQSDCSVFIIPPTSKFSFIDRIVYTTDFEFRDLGAINYLYKWTKRLGATLHCIHILEKEKQPVLAQRNMKILEELYHSKKDPAITFELIDGKLVKEVVKYTKENEVDVLAMATHNRGFWGRLLLTYTSIEVAKRVNVPSLIMKYD